MTFKDVDISLLGDAGARVFAIACATRARVVVPLFGNRETIDLYHSMLDALWEIQKGDPDVGSRFFRKLSSVAKVYDPYDRDHYAMRALGVLSAAVEAVFADSIESAFEAAKGAADNVCDLVTDLAFDLNDPKGEGISESEELAFQERISETILAAEVGWETEVRGMSEREQWPEELLRSIEVGLG